MQVHENSHNTPVTQKDTKDVSISRHYIGDKSFDSIFKQYDADHNKRLDSNEVQNFMADYNKMLEEGFGEKNKNIFQTFFNKIKSYMSEDTSTKVYQDGKEVIANGILEDNEQGSIGDCWLLSQLNSLKGTDFGREGIENAVRKNNDGSYTIFLNGVNKSYTFSSNEIQALIDLGEFSTGDLDYILFERTIEKYYDDEYECAEMDSRSIEGGYMEPDIQQVAYLLGLGTEFCATENRSDFPILLKQKAQNKEKVSIYISSGYDLETKKKFDDNDRHAYSVKEVKTDKAGNISEVIVINSWDNSKEIPLTMDEFMLMVGEVTSTAKDKKITSEFKKIHQREDNIIIDKLMKIFKDPESRFTDLMATNKNIKNPKELIKKCGGMRNYIKFYGEKYDKEYPGGKRDFTFYSMVLIPLKDFEFEEIQAITENPEKLKEYCKKYGFKY